jgi:hypothetical protein
MLLFADGHAENRLWTDYEVVSQAGNFVTANPVPQPPYNDLNNDLTWVLSITTIHR